MDFIEMGTKSLEIDVTFQSIQYDDRAIEHNWRLICHSLTIKVDISFVNEETKKKRHINFIHNIWIEWMNNARCANFFKVMYMQKKKKKYNDFANILSEAVVTM